MPFGLAIPVLACIALLLGLQTAQASVEVQDDSGKLLRLSEPADRIISLAPSLTELAFAAGAGDKLIATVEYSDYPQAAQRLLRIGRHDMLDLERILQLQPDLILAWGSGNPRSILARLSELGLKVYVAEPRSLDSIPLQLRRIAELAGTRAAAAPVVAGLEQKLSSLRRRFSSAPAVNTFYQVWNEPLITSGGSELMNDIIELCGGSNIFAELSMLAPKVSTEAVLQRDPEVIIASGMDVERPEWLDQWRQWPSLQAVQRDNLFFVPPDLLQRHTPRALQGAEQLCLHLQQARSRRPASYPLN